MIKKDVDYKWTKERRDAFMKIKEEIVEAPTLWILDFEKDFILYTFSSDHSIRKPQLDSWTFGVAGPIGLSTHYH